jgi:hypothetical protein
MCLAVNEGPQGQRLDFLGGPSVLHCSDTLGASSHCPFCHLAEWHYFIACPRTLPSPRFARNDATTLPESQEASTSYV